jgi:hypothetical protein
MRNRVSPCSRNVTSATYRSTASGSVTSRPAVERKTARRKALRIISKTTNVPTTIRDERHRSRPLGYARVNQARNGS